jgi:hypothetical protein
VQGRFANFDDSRRTRQFVVSMSELGTISIVQKLEGIREAAMVFGSRNKPAAAELNGAGGQGVFDDSTEALSPEKLRRAHFIPACSALAAIKTSARKPLHITEISNKIGKQLGKIYGGVLGEPLPDRISERLNALEWARD